jgi:hypothetical protein
MDVLGDRASLEVEFVDHVLHPPGEAVDEFDLENDTADTRRDSLRRWRQSDLPTGSIAPQSAIESHAKIVAVGQYVGFANVVHVGGANCADLFAKTAKPVQGSQAATMSIALNQM